MKLIYSHGFSESERLDWSPVVFSNIIQSFQTIQQVMAELNYEFDNEDNEVSSRVSQHIPLRPLLPDALVALLYDWRRAPTLAAIVAN